MKMGSSLFSQASLLSGEGILPPSLRGKNLWYDVKHTSYPTNSKKLKLLMGFYMCFFRTIHTLDQVHQDQGDQNLI